MLVGQANVAIRHARWVKMTHTITRDLGEARDLVRRFDKHQEEGVLFGTAFPKKIQEEKEETKAGLLALGARPKGHRHDKFKSERRPFQEEPARFNRPERGGYIAVPRGRGGRGQGRGQARGRGASQERYVHLSFSSLKPESKSESVSCSKSSNNASQENKLTIYPSCLSKTIPLHPEIGKLNLIPPVITQGKIAGLVRKAATNWSKITSDKTIVKMVQGCSIQFIDNPPANLKTYQPSFSNQERALISNEIEKMKLKGAILEVPPAQHQFLGHFFLRPMKEGHKGRYSI